MKVSFSGHINDDLENAGLYGSIPHSHTDAKITLELHRNPQNSSLETSALVISKSEDHIFLQDSMTLDLLRN